jgi:hypothetical protein
MAGPVGEAVPSTRVVVKAIERNGKNSLAGNRLYERGRRHDSAPSVNDQIPRRASN